MVCDNFHKIKNQLLASSVANIVAFAQGCNIGWLAPALPLLMSDATPLSDGPISNSMVGWVGAFLALGAVVGTLFFGFLSNFIGYKKSILLCSIPITICWLFIIFGTTAWHICMSRFFSGLTNGGAFTCIPQFVAEIASDFYRGELNSNIQTSCYFGILCGFICGSYLEYEMNPMIMIALPPLFVIGFAFMPESPQFLLRANQIEGAEKSLRFYRNCQPSSNKDDERELQEEFEKFKTIAKQSSEDKLSISEFFTPTALRAMMVCPFLMAVSQFSGSFVISNYAVTIFEQTGSTVDPNVSSIVMGLLQVFGTHTASMLMDKVGRKVLLLISTAGGCVALLVAATFTLLSRQGYDLSAFSFIPVASLSFYLFICAIGLLPVPYVMVSEVLPQRIRRIGSTLCTCAVFSFQFGMLKLFPSLLTTLHLYGCMYAFAVVCTVGFVFTLFVVKETKGKNLDVIEIK